MSLVLIYTWEVFEITKRNSERKEGVQICCTRYGKKNFLVVRFVVTRCSMETCTKSSPQIIQGQATGSLNLRGGDMTSLSLRD